MCSSLDTVTGALDTQCGFQNATDQSVKAGYRMTAFGEYADDGTASTMKARDYKDATDLVVCYAMTTEQTPKTNLDCALTLTKQSPTGGGQVQCVAYGIPGNWIGRAPENSGNATEPHFDRAPCLTAADRHGVAYGLSVRRLTPTECERLQGFPDEHTLVRFKGKPAADGPRYKALGNSMAVPCMAWIGKRIDKYLKGDL